MHKLQVHGTSLLTSTAIWHHIKHEAKLPQEFNAIEIAQEME